MLEAWANVDPKGKSQTRRPRPTIHSTVRNAAVTRFKGMRLRVIVAPEGVHQLYAGQHSFGVI